LDVAHSEPAVAPTAAAGVLLAARTLGQPLGLSMPPARAIARASGVSRSRAYEQRDAILSWLPSLSRPPGRPRAAPGSPPAPEMAHALRGEALRFVMDHPGSVYGGPERRRYSQGYRRFVLELRERYDELELPAFAEALELPLGTLQDWLRPGGPTTQPDASADAPAPHDATVAQVEMLLDAWQRWDGRALGPFGQHVRHHLHLPFGDSMIAKLLYDHGARTPRRRSGRSPDEEALRGAFETFFAGAQWVGDGTALEVVVDGEAHELNLELMVDAHSGAFVGLDVTDAEDSPAVAAAFEDGTAATGEPPLALLLDNKPCNHSPEVDAALGETMRIRATERRPQNKGHVEGAFGLFAQGMPPIEVDTADPRRLARQLALLVAASYGRAINHRPRRDRDGQSRLALYGEPVTDAQRQHAAEQLRARLRKQEQARATRAARLDPAVRELLDRAFTELGLDDPERHVRDAIATYPLDAITDGVATFRGKCDAGTLPADADARYLFGIVRNIAHVHEADAITDALLDERLAARDRLLQPLREQRARLAREHDEPPPHLHALVDHAMRAERSLARRFWLRAAADVVREQSHECRQGLARDAARRIHSFFRVPTHERAAAERIVLRRIWPLD